MVMAMAGDKAAYNVVLRHITTHLSKVLARKLPPKDKDDVIQDILLSIHKARHTYDGQRPLMPWVMAIARFRMHDHWRKYYSRPQDQAVDIEDFKNILSHDETKSMDAHEDITRVLATLPPKQQKILDLIYRQDKSMQDVADEMKMSLSAVKVAAHRTYKLLRQRMLDE